MSNDLKVLIIEDDVFLSSLLKGRFEKEGFRISQAFDGDQALEILKKETPDIILLDLIMPKKSGFEVLEALSLDPKLSRVPVVIVTNLAQEEDIEKVRNLGALEYFVKARTSIDDLIQKIKEIASKKRLKI